MGEGRLANLGADWTLYEAKLGYQQGRKSTAVDMRWTQGVIVSTSERRVGDVPWWRP